MYEVTCHAHACTCAGLEVEGLYRMSGKKNEILRLKSKFDTGNHMYITCASHVHHMTIIFYHMIIT